MAGLFSRLIDFMDQEEWKYEIVEGETVLRFYFKGSAGRLLCYADVEEDKDWLIFYSYLPVNVPGEKIASASEFFARANRGMRIGNFELDVDDGEIRYKTSIDVEGGDLTHKMMDNLLRANLSTMNRYFNGVMQLIYSNRSATDLIREIEQPGSSVGSSMSIEDDDEEDDSDIDSDLDEELDLDLDEDEEDDDNDGDDNDNDDGHHDRDNDKNDNPPRRG